MSVCGGVDMGCVREGLSLKEDGGVYACFWRAVLVDG